MITHIFFDAGNTLVYANMAYVSETLARHGVRVAPDRLREAEYRARVEIDRPEVIAATTDHSRWLLYFRKIFAGCGVEGPVVDPVLDALLARHRTSNLWEVVPPEVPAALEGLKGCYRLAVISNANGTVREKLVRVGLAGYFEAILDSHEEGVEKPDPRIFEAAMARTGARPASSVYVGDMVCIDVEGARRAGMTPVLIDPGEAHREQAVPRIRGLGGLAACIDALARGGL